MRLLQAVAWFALPLAASAARMPVHHPGMMQTGDPNQVSAATVNVPDVSVLDQNGHRIHFYRDLVQNKVVAINFIFTTCTTICPPMGAIFGHLQKLVAPVESKVRLISVSIDPVTDTPQRLKAWSAQFGAGSGWTLVTGDTAAIDKLLSSLGGFTPDKKDHAPLVLVGNDRTGKWTRMYGLAPAKRIESVIEEMMAGAPAVHESAGSSRR